MYLYCHDLLALEETHWKYEGVSQKSVAKVFDCTSTLQWTPPVSIDFLLLALIAHLVLVWLGALLPSHDALDKSATHLFESRGLLPRVY